MLDLNEISLKTHENENPREYKNTIPRSYRFVISANLCANVWTRRRANLQSAPIRLIFHSTTLFHPFLPLVLFNSRKQRIVSISLSTRYFSLSFYHWEKNILTKRHFFLSKETTVNIKSSNNYYRGNIFRQKLVKRKENSLSTICSWNIWEGNARGQSGWATSIIKPWTFGLCRSR